MRRPRSMHSPHPTHASRVGARVPAGIPPVCARAMEAIGTFYFSSARDLGHNSIMTTTHACGIVAPIPWELLAEELPPVFSIARERRALGTFFMPRARVREMTGIVENTLQSTGWTSLQWRRVPVCFDGFDYERRQAHARDPAGGRGRTEGARKAHAVRSTRCGSTSRPTRRASRRAGSRSCRCRRAPSSTRACSHPPSCPCSTRTCGSRPSRRRSPCCRRRSAPRPRRSGRWRRRFTRWRTTAS